MDKYMTRISVIYRYRLTAHTPVKGEDEEVEYGGGGGRVVDREEELTHRPTKPPF